MFFAAWYHVYILYARGTHSAKDVTNPKIPSRSSTTAVVSSCRPGFISAVNTAINEVHPICQLFVCVIVVLILNLSNTCLDQLMSVPATSPHLAFPPPTISLLLRIFRTTAIFIFRYWAPKCLPCSAFYLYSTIIYLHNLYKMLL